MIKKILLFGIITFILTSCSQNQQNLNSRYKAIQIPFFTNGEFTELNKAIIEISNQLLINIPYYKQKNNKFVITTFVNLSDFKKTNKLARIISESLINEMHTKRFEILDFRTKEVINVDKKGEFSLTRDTNQLRDEIPNSLIILGTYSKYDKNKIIINARIVDNFSSQVLSTAKVIYEYEDCKILNICIKEKNYKVSNIDIEEDK